MDISSQNASPYQQLTLSFIIRLGLYEVPAIYEVPVYELLL